MSVTIKRLSNRFLTLPEVQSFLGVKSRKTILKYIRQGKLTAYKIGGTRWRIALQDVDAFLGQPLIHSKQTKSETRPLVRVSS